MRIVRAVSVAVVLGLLGLLVWDLASSDKSTVATKVDKGQTVTAPALALPRLGESGHFDLASYRGKVVVVNFWASWCVDCKYEAKTLADGAARWAPDRRVVFLGVDTQDLGSAAKKWLAHYGVEYPIARDGSGAESRRWGVTGFPETFVVDPSGKVVPPHVIGPITTAQLNNAIKGALRS
jgi:cytochrome c biogenesis protein CcmG/thiol:disulfide interchange protein DsbE